MRVEEQIYALMKQAEARRLVSDLYNQERLKKEIAKHVPICLTTVYGWIDFQKRKSVEEKHLKARVNSSSDETNPEVFRFYKESENAFLKVQIKEIKTRLRKVQAVTQQIKITQNESLTLSFDRTNFRNYCFKRQTLARFNNIR